MRPLVSYFDSLFVTSCYGGIQLYTAAYLIPKYGSYKNPALFREFTFAVAGISVLCTVLGLVGIWNKDRPEYYQVGGMQKIRIRDYWDVLRHNRPIRQLGKGNPLHPGKYKKQGHNQLKQDGKPHEQRKGMLLPDALRERNAERHNHTGMCSGTTGRSGSWWCRHPSINLLLQYIIM